MKTKSITSKELGEWLATFYNWSTAEEYKERLHALRCVFEDDEEFWNEACEYAKKEIKK